MTSHSSLILFIIIIIILFGKEIQTLHDKCQQKILQPLERRGQKEWT